MLPVAPSKFDADSLTLKERGSFNPAATSLYIELGLLCGTCPSI